MKVKADGTVIEAANVDADVAAGTLLIGIRFREIQLQKAKDDELAAARENGLREVARNLAHNGPGKFLQCSLEPQNSTMLPRCLKICCPGSSLNTSAATLPSQPHRGEVDGGHTRSSNVCSKR